MKKKILFISLITALLFSVSCVFAYAEGSTAYTIVREGIDFDTDIVYKTHFDPPRIDVENEDPKNFQIYDGWDKYYTKFSKVVKIPKNSPAKITVDYGIIGTINNKDIKLKLVVEDIVWANRPPNGSIITASSYDYDINTEMIYFGNDPTTGYIVMNIYLHKTTYSLTYADGGASLEDPIITFGSLNNQGKEGREGNKPINVTKISMTSDSAMKQENLLPCYYNIPAVSLSAEEKKGWFYGYSPDLSNVDDWVYNPLTGKVDAYNPKVAISAFYTDSTNMEVYVTSRSGSIWENAFFIAKAPKHDLTIKKETNVPEDNTEFDFKLKIWKEHKTSTLQTVDLPDPEGEAYAVFDSADGTLTFFRDEAGKYANGQVSGTKTYYAGFEKKIEYNPPLASGEITEIKMFSPPWVKNIASIKKVVFEDEIIPLNTDQWFAGATMLTEVVDIENLKMYKVQAARSMFRDCSSLTSLDTSQFYMPECRVCGSMFAGCSNLTYLDLSLLNFEMFYNATQKETTGFASMFMGCSKLKTELVFPCLPLNHNNVFLNAATAPGAEIKFKVYTMLQQDIDKLLSQAGPNSNVKFDGRVSELPHNLPDYITEDEIIYKTEIHPYDLTEDPRFNYDIDTQTYSFKLSAGQALTINDLPKGYYYTVEEVDIPRKYDLVSSTNTAGAINDENIVATFRNERKRSDLTINKIVSGNMGDKSKQFEFAVSFMNGEGGTDAPYDPVAVPAGVTKLSEGKYIMKLSHGESLVFKNLPIGVKYEISENDYSSEGYETKVDETPGITVSGAMTMEDSDHKYENSSAVAVPTGVTVNDYHTGLILIAISSLWLAILALKKLLVIQIYGD